MWTKALVLARPGEGLAPLGRSFSSLALQNLYLFGLGKHHIENSEIEKAIYAKIIPGRPTRSIPP